uniref:Uncharacterized protein n=1 Tax=Monopterus albus TaxID=43700 RepID=A0A3Q3JXE6_MONAL
NCLTSCPSCCCSLIGQTTTLNMLHSITGEQTPVVFVPVDLVPRLVPVGFVPVDLVPVGFVPVDLVPVGLLRVGLVPGACRLCACGPGACRPVGLVPGACRPAGLLGEPSMTSHPVLSSRGRQRDINCSNTFRLTVCTQVLYEMTKTQLFSKCITGVDSLYELMFAA